MSDTRNNANILRAATKDWDGCIQPFEAIPIEGMIRVGDLVEAADEIERLSAENAELLEALKIIRGWREIDVSSDERFGPYNTFPATIKRIEEICDEAIAKHKESD